jgi:transcriptional regulator with XRE-family HTH domain
MKRVVAKDFPADPLITQPEALGAAIRAGRTQAGLKLEDAAASLGMAVKTLSAIEAGKPGVELGNVLRACVALGVDLFAVPRTRRETVRIRLAGLSTRKGSV